MAKLVRPTVRFREDQYRLIQAKLNELDVSFQQYCLELICRDFGVPIKEFQEETNEDQTSLFEDDVT